MEEYDLPEIKGIDKFLGFEKEEMTDAWLRFFYVTNPRVAMECDKALEKVNLERIR